MLSAFSLRKVLLIFVLVGCAFVGGKAEQKVSAPLPQGAAVAIEEADVAIIQRLLGKGETKRSAPRVWSSRREIRWNARWESAPRFVV